MEVEIEPLDKEFEDSLRQIIDAKHYKLEHESWKKFLLPHIKARLLVIISRFNDSDEQKPHMEAQHEEILKNLDNKFGQEPPFTVLRIAELIYDPLKEGYKLDKSTYVLKYLHALVRTVLVSSTVKNFPEPTFSSQMTNGNERIQDVAYVKIPWFNGSKEDNDNDGSNTRPREEEAEEEAEKDQDVQDSPSNKRHKMATNDGGDDQQEEEIHNREDKEDNMEISNSTLEEIDDANDSRNESDEKMDISSGNANKE